MKYEIISADGHLDHDYLPGDVFVSSASSANRDKLPRRIEVEDGYEWWAGDLLVSMRGRGQRTGTPETTDRIAKLAQSSFFDDAERGMPHPASVELRLKDQDVDGVDAEVIYGLTFLGTRMLGTSVKPGQPRGDTQPEVVAEMYRIYNDWAADFSGQRPDRLACVACLPNHDPQAAAAELRRAAKMGLKGGTIEVYGSTKPIFYEDWDVLWKASAECMAPVNFHITGYNFRRSNPEDAEKYADHNGAIGMVLSQLEGAELLTATILSGACERYPDFKFILAETGVAWLPFVLDRMDHECTGFGELKMKPSDYWRRQGYVTYQQEGHVGEVAHLVGEDNIMWGSDYPHQDGVWPDSRRVIERDLQKLADETRRKITCDNAAKLYGWG